MRSRKKIIAALLVLVVMVGWPVAAHYRAKNKVAAYRRQLIALGEKMSVAELTPSLPPADDNGAGGLMSAIRLAGSFNYTNQPPTMRAIAPGRALVAWRQSILPASDSTNVWPGLSEDLEKRSDALDAMRAALEKPALAVDLDYSQGFHLLLPHLVQFKTTSQWLSAATMPELHENRVTNAVQNLRAMTALVAHHKNEPLMISSLVRIAIGAITMSTVWEALQSPDLNDEQLAGLQADWEAVDFLTQFEAAMSMERAMGEEFFTEWRKSPRALLGIMSGGANSASGLTELVELGKGVLGDPSKGMKEVVHRYLGYWMWKWWWSYEDELVQMQSLQATLIALGEVRKEKCFSPALNRCDQSNEAIRTAHPKAGGWLDYDVAPIFQKFLVRLRTIEMQRHLLVTAIAIKRFQLRYGHYPGALTQLAPDFLREPPRDPIDGQPLRYRLQPDGSFLLYSVGEDGVDNGGDPSQTPENQNPTAPRPNWLKGRDVVWPQPATPQETLLYQLAVAGDREQDRIRSRVIVTNGMPATMLSELERLAQNYHFTLTNNAATAR